MNTNEYLAKTKNALGIQSDYALAQHLGVTRSAVSKLQKGMTLMGDETAIRVADILKMPRAAVLADVYAEREKNPEIAAVWRSVWEKFSVGFDYLLSGGLPHGALRFMR
jgi:transcriptional regulator with XRE-family HTH domain